MKNIHDYLIKESGSFKIPGIDDYLTDGIGQFRSDAAWNKYVKKYSEMFKDDPKKALLDIFNNVPFEYADDLRKFIGCVITDTYIK